MHTAVLEYDRDLKMWGAVCSDCDWRSDYLSEDQSEARREANDHERDTAA